MDSLKGLLTVVQAAERLSYHPQTLRNKARTGAIKSIRRGRMYFFTPETIEELLVACEDNESDEISL